MCFRPATASQSSRICTGCRMITEDTKAAVCPNCGGELAPLDSGGAKPAIPPPGASGGMAPPKAPPAPPKVPPAPPKKPGG